MNHLRKPHLCALGYGCTETVPGFCLGCPTHEAVLTPQEASEMELAWASSDETLTAIAAPIVKRVLAVTKPPADPCEEAYYHPGARHVWERLLRTIARRKLNIHATDAALVALALADAGRDKLIGARGCIYIRNGRQCPGNHAADCDIPF